MNISLQPVHFKRFYLITMSVVMSIAFMCYAALTQSTQNELLTSEHNNWALQLQMQVVTINTLAEHMLEAASRPVEIDTLRKELSQEISNLQAAHQVLLNMPRSETVQSIYDQSPYALGTHLDHEIQYATAMLTGAGLDNKPLLEIQPDLLKGIMALRDQLRLEYQVVLNAKQVLEFGILLAAMVSLLALGWFIFRPMQQQIIANEARLRQEIDRTQAIAVALRQSEARFHTLVDFAPVGIVEFDLKGNMIFTNRYWDQMAGGSGDHFSGNKIIPTYHPLDLERMEKLHVDITDNGRPVNHVEFRYLQPDGTVVWADKNGRSIRDVQGNVTSYICIETNITDRKLAEEALRENERRLRLITDNIRDVVMQTDTENRIVFISPSCQTQLGYAPDLMIGELALQRIHPDDARDILTKVQTMIQSPARSILLEGRVLHANGHYIPIEMICTFMFDADNNYTGWVSVARDITERKRLETVLRENEQRLRLITDNIQDLISQGDADNKLIFVSQSYETELGYESHALDGKLVLEILHPDDVQSMFETIQLVVQDANRNMIIQGRMLAADGHEVPVEMNCTFTYDADGNYTGWVSVARDISQRMLFQELEVESQKLAVALEKEQELNSLKTRMMERISHEFRTPLAIIQTSTEGLTTYFDRLSPEQRAKKGQTIRLQVRRIADMLAEIGTVLTGGLDSPEISRMPFDLSRVCREVVKQLELTFQQPDRFVSDVPEQLLIKADEMQMRSVIQHLLHNAARFSPGSSPIKICVMLQDQDVSLVVIDHGIGILPQERDHVFEPFFRGTNFDEVGGLGLGLTISLGIVKAHGGLLTVSDSVGGGTTARVWLPNVVL